MKLIVMIFVVLLISLTTGMGQSLKQEQAAKQTTTPTGKEICTIFVVDRVETKWTDLGPVSSLQGHLVRKKDCVEPPPPARKLPAKTKSF